VTVYTLFGQTGGDVVSNDTSGYTLAMEFTLSADAALTGIWFYSPSGANGLPTGCCIYDVVSQTEAAGTVSTSPSWSGAAGSGWVKCSYDGSVTLNASQRYKVAVLKPAGVSQVYADTTNYWGGGPGGSGLTSGIITAPSTAGADNGQDSFAISTVFAYPTGAFDASNYWVDLEVTVSSGTVSGSADLTGGGSLGPADSAQQAIATLQGAGAVGTTAGTASGDALNGTGQLGAPAAEGAVATLAGQGTLAAAATVISGGSLPPLPAGIAAGAPYSRWSAGEPHS
jgi:hypothetical protein